MSKNVNITEGGHAKSASNVARLATELQAGGLCHWVPEDERLIRTRYISANGKYLASEDAVYGYSKLTVNVPGGAAGATVPTFDEDGNSMTGTPADPTSPSWDPDTPTYGPVSVDSGSNPATITPVSGGRGSSVIGTDPEDGNDYMAEVDEDEEVTFTPMPSEIRIVKMPSKTKYKENEIFDFLDIQVRLYQRDGQPFTYERNAYPNGLIPYHELHFEPITAQYSGEQRIDTPILDGLDAYTPVPFGFAVASSATIQYKLGGRINTLNVQASQAVYMAMYYNIDHVNPENTFVGAMLASDGPFTYGQHETVHSRAVMYDGQVAYVGDYLTLAYISDIVSSTIPMNQALFSKNGDIGAASMIGWEMVNNKSATGRGTVTVSWHSKSEPYSSLNLSTTMEVMVTSTYESGWSGSGGGEF